MMQNIWVYSLLNLIGLLLVPLFDGIIRKTKAILQGRKGPKLLQTYFDVIKLFHKEHFFSQFTSGLSKIAPIIILLMSLLFFFMIPLGFQGISVHIFVLIFIFAIGSLFTVLYGLDNATYFAGLGASREVFVILFVEPLLFLSLAILAYNAGVGDIQSLHDFIHGNYFVLTISIQIILFSIILRYVLVAENKRYPFDNPTTHLELTMIHEAMLLETSGPTLAMLELASKINLIGFMSIFAFLLLPFDFGITNVFLLRFLRVAKIFIICIFLGLWETYVTKLRVFKYPVILLGLLALQMLFLVFYKLILQ